MESSSFRHLFLSEFDREIYDSALLHVGKYAYHPLRKCYTVLAIGKALQDVAMSRDPSSGNLLDDPYTALLALAESDGESAPSYVPAMRKHYLSIAIVRLLLR